MAIEWSVHKLGTDIYGRPAWGCSCLAVWLPLVQQMAVQRGLVKQSLDLAQGGMWSLVGGTGAAASAGTHDRGGVIDLAQFGDGVVQLVREAGAAGWHRTVAQGFSGDHLHLVLIGCPHNAPAAYQVTCYRDGYDGLGTWRTLYTAAHRDDGPRVSPIRTWTQGVAWMQQQLAINQSSQEALMPLTTADIGHILGTPAIPSPAKDRALWPLSHAVDWLMREALARRGDVTQILDSPHIPPPNRKGPGWTLTHAVDWLMREALARRETNQLILDRLADVQTTQAQILATITKGTSNEQH